MARRKQPEPGAAATQDRILESGKKLFLKYGFQAAPLRKIAEDAGFTSGALYGYFKSKEDLFYAVTEPAAEKILSLLEGVRAEMTALPEEKRLACMGEVYYRHIPEIVDFLVENRETVDLIINGSKGTRYENFIDEIANRNADSINSAARSFGREDVRPIEARIMKILMEGYVTTLFRLITSDHDAETICKSMEAIGYIYEKGMISLMRKEKENGAER